MKKAVRLFFAVAVLGASVAASAASVGGVQPATGCAWMKPLCPKDHEQ
ncbi:hypothetical protein [Deinococcus multiflagellatus]|uniref:Uncharacterized protein n=1 Tax=Deinococcus multiflagellatus TaxID=1656887 RepID=A0ABW1ZHG1_9DEIO|nr:hypothetical protein [Deinococcus multiflagellatus]MBZ9712727.1 hypothetical protein [Deinococcus multiflagellatus]